MVVMAAIYPQRGVNNLNMRRTKAKRALFLFCPQFPNSMNAPPSEPSVLASKKLHYAALHDELQQLNNNVQKLKDNLKVTAEQAPAFRKMQVLHSSM